MLPPIFAIPSLLYTNETFELAQVGILFICLILSFSETKVGWLDFNRF